MADLATDLVDTETATVGDTVFAVGDGDSPETFTPYCAVFDIGAIGEKNDQVEVTTFCNGGTKHYISGISDGNVVTLKAYLAVKAGSADKTVQDRLIAAVKNKTNIDFRMQMGIDSPFILFAFNAAMLSYEITPSFTKAHEITYTMKISGALDYT